MHKIICPNCRTLVPALLACRKCSAPLSKSDSVISDTYVQAINHAPLEPSMDPHLWREYIRVSEGICKEEDEVEVVAFVTDIDQFKNFVGGKVYCEIDAPAADKLEEVSPVIAKKAGYESQQLKLVTARIKAGQIKELRGQKYVISLKRSWRLRPCLESVIEEVLMKGRLKHESTESSSIMNNTGERIPTGSDVIVGFVDFGLDFAHKNFQDIEGKTRILALWDQTHRENSEEKTSSRKKLKGTEIEIEIEIEVKYGKLFTREEIDGALAPDKPNPYDALDYKPSLDSSFDIGSHGTYVADVAVGNGEGTDTPGFAPEAELVFVDIGTASTPQPVGRTFGDSAQLIEAIDFIFKLAKDLNRPCVINISLGANDGPHDGTTPVETAIDWLLTQSDVPNRAVVVAAGNSFGENLHATGTIHAT
ncbi:MAG: S8 family serine peptidase, partial [Nitrososphaera sp.]|nr:S8 family serine peptidase [Nitrososphaera sp.]